jgi:hypothetical protein
VSPSKDLEKHLSLLFSDPIMNKLSSMDSKSSLLTMENYHPGDQAQVCKKSKNIKAQEANT